MYVENWLIWRVVILLISMRTSVLGYWDADVLLQTLASWWRGTVSASKPWRTSIRSLAPRQWRKWWQLTRPNTKQATPRLVAFIEECWLVVWTVFYWWWNWLGKNVDMLWHLSNAKLLAKITHVSVNMVDLYKVQKVLNKLLNWLWVLLMW